MTEHMTQNQTGDVATISTNDVLMKSLVRQLKILNIWITFFGSLVVVAMVVMAILLFSLIGFIKDTGTKIDNARTQANDSVNLKKQACEGNDGFSDFLRSSTGVCD